MTALSLWPPAAESRRELEPTGPGRHFAAWLVDLVIVAALVGLVYVLGLLNIDGCDSYDPATNTFAAGCPFSEIREVARPDGSVDLVYAVGNDREIAAEHPTIDAVALGTLVVDPPDSRTYVVGLGYVLAVFVLLQGLTGRTPGKLLFGCRLVREDGRRPGVGRALVRWLVLDGVIGLAGVAIALAESPWLLRLLAADAAFGLVGGLTLLFTSYRTLGDAAAKTLVVSDSDLAEYRLQGTANDAGDGWVGDQVATSALPAAAPDAAPQTAWVGQPPADAPPALTPVGITPMGPGPGSSAFPEFEPALPAAEADQGPIEVEPAVASLAPVAADDTAVVASLPGDEAEAEAKAKAKAADMAVAAVGAVATERDTEVAASAATEPVREDDRPGDATSALPTAHFDPTATAPFPIVYGTPSDSVHAPADDSSAVPGPWAPAAPGAFAPEPAAGEPLTWGGSPSTERVEATERLEGRADETAAADEAPASEAAESPSPAVTNPPEDAWAPSSGVNAAPNLGAPAPLTYQAAASGDADRAAPATAPASWAPTPKVEEAPSLWDQPRSADPVFGSEPVSLPDSTPTAGPLPAWGRPTPSAEPETLPRPADMAKAGSAETQPAPTTDSGEPAAAREGGAATIPTWAQVAPTREPAMASSAAPAVAAEQPGWRAGAAPASGRQPQWDEARQAYIFWDDARQEWLQYDYEAGAWGPISRA